MVKAAEYAKERGLIVISVTGFKGGKLKELADYAAYINHDSYEVCEDIHAIFNHFLATNLRANGGA